MGPFRGYREDNKIPFKINDDIIISNNDKDNDVSNGCLINTDQASLGRTQ